MVGAYEDLINVDSGKIKMTEGKNTNKKEKSLK